MIYISRWTGRTGNNIQQCAIGLLAAEALNNSFTQGLSHNIIDLIGYRFGSGSIDIAHDWFNFYGPGAPFIIDLEYVHANIHRVCKRYLYPYLKVEKQPSLARDTLVIHIRSGDIMDQNISVHSDYVPNPLIYYYNLISRFRKTIIVTEPDNNNPVTSLLKRNPTVSIQSTTVAKDLGTLMSATNLASSGVGTFCMAAALCSQNLENYYCTDLMIPEHLNYQMLLNTDVKVHVYKLRNYIKPGEWRNTESQRDLLLNFRNEILHDD